MGWTKNNWCICIMVMDVLFSKFHREKTTSADINFQSFQEELIPNILKSTCFPFF